MSGEWGSDSFFFTEAARGGPLTWRVDGTAFEGDALGPVRHAHDGAAEYYFMLQGSLRVECGGEELTIEQGDLCYIPPDAPHNALGPASKCEEVHMFCFVAPNQVGRKWRIAVFGPDAEALRASVARPFEHLALPGDEVVSAEALRLTRDDAPTAITHRDRESVYLVVDGVANMALHGGLSGAIGPGTYVHVRAGMRHELWTASACSVLRLDAAFAPWAHVDLPAEAR